MRVSRLATCADFLQMKPHRASQLHPVIDHVLTFDQYEEARAHLNRQFRHQGIASRFDHTASNGKEELH